MTPECRDLLLSDVGLTKQANRGRLINKALRWALPTSAVVGSTAYAGHEARKTLDEARRLKDVDLSGVRQQLEDTARAAGSAGIQGMVDTLRRETGDAVIPYAGEKSKDTYDTGAELVQGAADKAKQELRGIPGYQYFSGMPAWWQGITSPGSAKNLWQNISNRKNLKYNIPALLGLLAAYRMLFGGRRR